MSRLLDRVHDHVIVCGVGSTGRHVVAELLRTRTPFVVIDAQEDRIDRVAAERNRSFLYVIGDATDDAVLQEAGIDRANGLVAALAEDKDNLFVTITARALNERLRIVAKGVEQDNAQKLRRAGADTVVSPSYIGGMRMASEMIRPAVVSFLDNMVRDTEAPRRIEEVQVPAQSHLVGMSLAETDLRRDNDALVLAIRGIDGRHRYNPAGETVVRAGDVLIVLLKASDLPAFRTEATRQK